MNTNNSDHYKIFSKILRRENRPLSLKLAKILSYIVNYLGIDNKKYFISGSYALNDYFKYKEINNININMDPTEFKKLENFGLGEIIKSNNNTVWILDLKDLYNDINNNKVKNLYIEIFKIPMSKGYPTDKYSLNNLIEICGLKVDKYKNEYFTIPMFYEWKKDMNRPVDQEDIKFIEKNNLLQSEKPKQCGGGNYYEKYMKYKIKYLNLKEK